MPNNDHTSSRYANQRPCADIGVYEFDFYAIQRGRRHAVLVEARGVPEGMLYRFVIPRRYLTPCPSDGYILAKVSESVTLPIEEISGLRLKMMGYESREAFVESLRVDRCMDDVSLKTRVTIVQLKDAEHRGLKGRFSLFF